MAQSAVPGPAAATVEARVQDGRASLRLAGELSLACGPELWAGLQQALGGLPPGLALDVDLSQVRSADGGGAALLREALAAQRRSGRAVALSAGPPELLARLGSCEP